MRSAFLLCLAGISPCALATPALAGPDAPARIAAARAVQPPVVDGRLDDAVWRDAAPATGFWKFRPVDDQPATQRTEVWFAYDDASFYVAFRAHDDAPSGVRAALAVRDQCMSDDLVGIVLDTFNDGRRGYELFCNPLGVQADGVIVEGQDDDFSVDYVWRSAGRLTPDGYEVEMAIPLGSLRYSDADRQTWSVAVIRMLPARGEQHAFPHLLRGRNCLLCQSADLTGIEGLHPGRTFELLPAMTGLRRGATDESLARFRYEQDRYQAGLGVKLGITPALTADLAVNPDFSQVESDAAQVEVNQRFALYYPEKRPFFLEGQEIFGSPLQLVYTRTIFEPLVAAKLSGKSGGTTIGVLGALDDTPLVPRGDAGPGGAAALARRAVFDIVRLKQDVGRDATLGFLATGREYPGAWNRLAGLDAQVRFRRLWSWVAQGVGSETRDLDGGRKSGAAYTSELSRAGGHLQLDLAYNDIAPGFRADAGFIRRTDLREGVAVAGWQERPDSAAIRRLRASLSYRQLYDHADVRQEAQLAPALLLEFPRKVTLFVRERWRMERFAGADFRGARLDAALEGEPWKLLTGGLAWDEGEEIHYDPADAFLAWGREWDAWATLRAGEKLKLELTATRVTEWRGRGGARVFDVEIARVKASYQFTRALALRVIPQWQSVDEDGGRDRDLDVNVLASCQPGPGTVFYLGVDDGWNDPATDPVHRFHRARRALFFKASYLWRVNAS
ncbi:MAG: carbohydrate binding family 9 domain-containing protein [Candidatus Eisenbacteria bacterium]|nr:carbohydrate binding family 9 domain-containing protein [Candidatus Eisenbacteria bacterium]